ncbi:hypothetical protein CR983_01220 [Candidatus Saccharibacteria bacterium]|nr:MAG: hypothetical protein CR983_01220 [Candidatus Saccharibacteria bacterium]
MFEHQLPGARRDHAIESAAVRDDESDVEVDFFDIGNSVFEHGGGYFVADDEGVFYPIAPGAEVVKAPDTHLPFIKVGPRLYTGDQYLPLAQQHADGSSSGELEPYRGGSREVVEQPDTTVLRRVYEKGFDDGYEQGDKDGFQRGGREIAEEMLKRIFGSPEDPASVKRGDVVVVGDDARLRPLNVKESEPSALPMSARPPHSRREAPRSPRSVSPRSEEAPEALTFADEDEVDTMPPMRRAPSARSKSSRPSTDQQPRRVAPPSKRPASSGAETKQSWRRGSKGFVLSYLAVASFMGAAFPGPDQTRVASAIATVNPMNLPEVADFYVQAVERALPSNGEEGHDG